MAPAPVGWLFVTFCICILVAVGDGSAIRKQKPNIVFMLVDDQDRVLGVDSSNYTQLGSVDAMPTVKSRLINEGTWFENFFVNTPICCPSRTEFLTGRYFHNVKATERSDTTTGHPEVVAEQSASTCMHANTTFAGLKNEGMFGLLTSLGYNTGIFGKTTNNQMFMLDMLVQQAAVSYIDSPLDYNSYTGLRYYNYDSQGGHGSKSIEHLDENNPRFGTTYQTAQIGNRTLAWLDTAAKAAKNGTAPFFAYLGFHAPHFPAMPAPWHQHLMTDLHIPLTPNYNVSCPDKAQHVRQNPALSELAHCWENAHFRDRWLSLLAVDDVIKALLDRLEKEGLLENTILIYTSDHGYKQGQWRIGTSKQHPYETDIRIPFVMRGPGVARGARISAMSSSVDLLPTLLEFSSGDENSINVDGRSLVRLLKEPSGAGVPWRDRVLNEYLSVGTYYNDHSQAWDDGTTLKRCGGPMPRGPAGKVEKCIESSGVGDGNCYFVDSQHSNSWRALRVSNRTHNFQYVEYDASWTFKEGSPMQHYEYYDLNMDPFQLQNEYKGIAAETKAALHSELVAYSACKGASCREGSLTMYAGAKLIV